MIPSKETKGYLLVASRDIMFYNWACNLLDGIKDFYPEAKICLVTEERFLDHKADQADEIIFCDDHYRAKLWGMANSPWDITFYIDVDMEVIHKDISKVFDELGESDMVFNILERKHWHIFMDSEFPGGKFELCGAVCLYRKSELVTQFMQEWYDIYVQQTAGKWWPKNDKGKFDYDLYPKRLNVWDQFTLWWLVNKEPKYRSLIIGEFEENMKWNYWAILDRTDFPMPENTVLIHMSCMATRTLVDIDL
tara:strand:+ start:782 stop:1531 length:750 start_codon:yes stop_codon:yes gene_type:complete